MVKRKNKRRIFRPSNRKNGAKWVSRTLLLVVALHFAFIFWTSTCILAYKFIDPPVTSLMIYRKVLYRWDFERRRPLKIKQVPLQLRNMIIRVEDGSFYEHHGVILAALKNAWRINQEIGHTVYGGSTITMQTARTLFLVPEKNYLRKYLEMIVAVEMEVILSKARIFELYLNNAEWGPGVFGIEAAAFYHYGRSVTKLSTDERIRLVTLLSSPIKYKPYTLQKSGILRSRYKYLSDRYN